MAEIRVGISGWRYAPWRNHFYPKGLLQKDELHFASRAVNSIEINGSFYALQTPERYAGWFADTPDDFVFSVKAPRYITHILRLDDVAIPIANFFASGVLHLKHKLGPILWQFPPSFKFDIEQFSEFLQLLPTTTQDALALSRKSQLPPLALTARNLPKLPLRHAVEIRNKSFCHADFVDVLRRFNVALVIADSAGRWPQLEDITAPFIYMRLHGDAELYRSGYSDTALQRWYQRMTLWQVGKQPNDAKLLAKVQPPAQQPLDIFCYFDNTDKLWAPYDARKILDKFELSDNLETTPGILDDQYQTARKKIQK